MFIPREEVERQHERLEPVRDEIVKQLMQIPGVLGVSEGVRTKNGELVPELCIKVTVEKKKDLKDVPESERIPSEIMGFKVDVEEKKNMRLFEDENKYRPLVAGSQVASQTVAGTLGCFATVKSGANAGKVVILSNWHVLVGERAGAISYEQIGQPNIGNCCACCECDMIGIVVDGEVQDAHLDCAIARIYTGGEDPKNIQWLDNVVTDIGYIAGAAPAISAGSPYSVKAGETVYKRGRTTLFTVGVVSPVQLSPFPLNYGGTSITRSDMMGIMPTPPYTDFALPGDSGAVIVNARNEVVGLLVGGDQGSHLTYACHISYVLTRMNITINSSLTGTGLPVGGVGFEGMVDTAEWWQIAEKALGQSTQGVFVRDLFQRHRRELIELIKVNREVQVAWQRYSGPAWLNHLVRSILEDHPLPDQIKGASLQSMLLKMMAVLMRHGSEALVRDLEAHAMDVIAMTGTGNRFSVWVEAAAQRSRIVLTQNSTISI